jgi:hypothetical protein
MTEEGWTQLHSDVIGWLFTWTKHYLAITAGWEGLQNIMAAEHIRFFSVLFKRRYNRLFVLPYSTIPLYSSLSTAILLQFWIFSCPTSLTSSSHLTLCLPILTANDYTFHRTFLIHFYNTPNPSHFLRFIYLTICARLVSKYICSLVLIFQLPKIGGYHAKFNLNTF